MAAKATAEAEQAARISEAPGSAPAITLEPEPLRLSDAVPKSPLPAMTANPEKTQPKEPAPLSVAENRRIYPRVYMLLAILIGAVAITLWRTFR